MLTTTDILWNTAILYLLLAPVLALCVLAKRCYVVGVGNLASEDAKEAGHTVRYSLSPKLTIHQKNTPTKLMMEAAGQLDSKRSSPCCPCIRLHGNGKHSRLESLVHGGSRPHDATSTGRCRNPHRESKDSAKEAAKSTAQRSEEHTSELQSLAYLVCRLLLE